MRSNQKVIIDQLNNTMLKYKDLTNLSYPSKGWIMTIRKALGMSSRQLARRTGVSQQRLSKIEQQEIYGNEKKKSYELAVDKIIDQMNKTFWDY